MRVLAGHADQNPAPRKPAAPRFMTVVGMPKTIALAYPQGKITHSRFTHEDQMMYTLTTGEKAWFSLDVARAIDSLQLAPGEPFVVCDLGRGNWDIERAAPSPHQAPKHTGAPAPSFLPPPTHTRNAPVAPSRPEPAPQKMNGAGEDTTAILTRCYTSAIDITVAAMEAARAKGLQLLPTHEGIQACAATLFIAETRRER